MNFKRNIEIKTGMDLTPLIDAVFILLIFFMVTYSQSTATSRAQTFALPEDLTSQGVSSEELLIVDIDPQGNILVDERPLDSNNLAMELRAIANRKGASEVFIRCYKENAVQLLVNVMDAAVQAGLELAYVGTVEAQNSP